MKVPSTPDDPSRAIMQGVEILLVDGRESEGHRLLLPRHHGRHERAARGEGRAHRPPRQRGLPRHLRGREQARPHGPAMFDVMHNKPALLAPASRTGEVRERVDFDGERAARPSTRGPCATTLRELAARGHRVHRRLPALQLPPSRATSSACARSSPRRFPAASSRCPPRRAADPRVRPAVDDGHQRLPAADPRALPRAAWAAGWSTPASTTAQDYIMQSNGGTATFDKAARKAAATLLSGPAGGVTAGAPARALVRRQQHHHLRHGRHLLRRGADRGRRADRSPTAA